MIGGPDNVEVMFHGDDGIAFGRKSANQAKKFFGVAGVESKRRFVQDEGDSGQADAEKSGQAEALGFPSREGIRRAIEAEVVEPDVLDEPETPQNLAPDGQGHGAGFRVHPISVIWITVKERKGFFNAQGEKIGDSQTPICNAERPGLQSPAAAGGAGLVLH
jgi:hypothetical protein